MLLPPEDEGPATQRTAYSRPPSLPSATTLRHSCSASHPQALFAVYILVAAISHLPTQWVLPSTFTMPSTLRHSVLALCVSTSTIASHMLPRPILSEWKFALEAQGGVSGSVGQLDDGQNRIGGKYPVAEFNYVPPKNGKVEGGVVLDSQYRGCIVTPPNITQWQCDQGVAGSPGWEFSCDKKLLFYRSPEFWACPVNDQGEWNIYVKPDFEQEKCVAITLMIRGEPWNPAGCVTLSPSVPSPYTPVSTSLLPPPSQSQNVSNSPKPSAYPAKSTAPKPSAYSAKPTAVPSSTAYGKYGKPHSQPSRSSVMSSPATSIYSKVSPSLYSNKHVLLSSKPVYAKPSHPVYSVKPALSASKPSHPVYSVKSTLSASKQIHNKTFYTPHPARPTLSASRLTYGKPMLYSSRPIYNKPITSSKAIYSKPSYSIKTMWFSSKVTYTNPTSYPKIPGYLNVSIPHYKIRANLTTSPNGLCGIGTNYTCLGFKAGSCCSSYGWCGALDVFCGVGCQTGYGTCELSSSKYKLPQTGHTAYRTSVRPVTPSQTSQTKYDANKPATAECEGGGSSVYLGILDVSEEVTVIGVKEKEGITVVQVHDEKNYTMLEDKLCLEGSGRPQNGTRTPNTFQFDAPKTPVAVAPTKSANATSTMPVVEVQKPKKPQVETPQRPPVKVPHKGQKEGTKHESGPDNKHSNHTASAAKWCPSNLDGDWESPRLIMATDKKGAIQSHRNPRMGVFSDTKCSVYDFYIDPRFTDKSCTLVWLFPEKKQLKGWDYSWQGVDGTVNVYRMQWEANVHTWNDSAPGQLVATGPVHPGVHWTATTMKCEPRRSVSFMACGSGVFLEYLQDRIPYPFGFFIRAC